MKTITTFTLAIICQLFIIGESQAQKSTIPTLTPPPANIVIDGNIKEWGDSLRYYNVEKKINFAIANTKDTLYMAIRVNDRSEQARILKAGITFSIDPKGKKSETFSITFPLNVQGTAAPAIDMHKDDNGDVSPQEREDLLRARITTLRGIRVIGFKDVEDEMITTSNTYGIQTAINYDENDYLVCEAAIPLSFFHVNDITKNEWAFNFKINGVTKPAPKTAGGEQSESGSGGRGGRGGGGGGFGGGGGGRGGGHKGGGNRNSGDTEESRSELFKSVDFWEKFYLAR